MNDVVIFGTGGHAKVVFDIVVRQQMYKPVAFVSPNNSLTQFLGLPHTIQSDFSKTSYKNGIVAVGDNFIRSQIVDYIKSVNPSFNFINAIHPSAQIGEDVVIGEGSVVMANVAINSGSRIGSHVIINTSSSIDHDCQIGQFASIAPGCTLGGNVHVGEFSAISLGANIIHGKKIGKHTVIGAGSLVISDIDAFKVAYGSPCKLIRDRQKGEKYL